MKNIRRFAIASVALALGLPAVAQNVDTANSTTTARRLSPAPAPAYTVPSNGSAKAILKDFSNYITQTGVGASGSDVSELYTSFTFGTFGYNVYGWGAQLTAGNILADDFVVPAGQTWTVSDLYWIFYQTGGPTSGTITGVDMELWNSDPTGQVVGAGWQQGTGIWIGNTWTGVYRVLDSGLGTINRALINSQCSAGWVPSLPAGTYWLSAGAAGSLSSGPWSPTRVEAGQTPPTGFTWNGLQAVGGGAFAQVFDSGNPAGSISEPAEWLFRIDGTGGGTGGVPTFCTSKPTSIAGCVPSLAIPTANVPKGGGTAVNCTVGPAPGGGNPGILIFNRTSLAAPVLTQFGYICTIPFLRAGAFPQLPGGTVGQCNGQYSFNLQAIVNGLPQVQAGDTTHWQLWYRDSPNPGGANMTEAAGPVNH